MGVMRTILGLVMIGVVLVVFGVLLLRRRGRDEIHSIDHYRHALDTLQEMRGPTGSSVRILSDDEVRELRQPSPRPVIRTDARAPIPPRIPPPPESIDGMVFDELGSPTEPGTAAEMAAAAEAHHRAPLHHEDPTWAISRMENRRPLQNREIKAAVGAGVVLVILIVVGVIIGRSSGDTSHTTSTTTRSRTTTTKGPVATTVPQPTSYAPVAGATAGAATYQVAGASYAVTVTATAGGCWTIATSGSGSQLFAGTVSPGSPQQIQGAAGMSISLGAPANATVEVNGVPVTFPASYSAPLVLTFVAPPTPTTTTTTTVPPSAATTTSPPTTRTP
jgi:hypothetical protein